MARDERSGGGERRVDRRWRETSGPAVTRDELKYTVEWTRDDILLRATHWSSLEQNNPLKSKHHIVINVNDSERNSQQHDTNTHKDLHLT